MPRSRILLFTLLAMLAFAGNSLLCRLALRDTALDAASFTLLRLLAGALVLAVLVRLRQRQPFAGDWPGALALFAYAGGFSYAYRDLGAATGALLLFGGVQAGMFLAAWCQGERPGGRQSVGLGLALAGVVYLLLPGARSPEPFAALLMITAGLAWVFYSLPSRRRGDPLAATAGNFLRAVPFALALCLVQANRLEADVHGVVYAVLSGGLASGLGYALWYAALGGLGGLQAASVQLSVPLLTALGGALLLAELPSLQWMLSGLLVLGGIALVLSGRSRRAG